MENRSLHNVRWKFNDGMSDVEKNLHDDISQKIDSWWQMFKENAQQLNERFKKQNNFDVVAFMSNLQTIHPQLMWEFGPAIKKKGNRLVITPESRKDLRPLVDEIIKKAPDLEDWEFYGYRQPETFEQAKITVEGRTRAPLANLYFFGEKNHFNQIDIIFILPNSTSDEEIKLAHQQGFIYLETLLGEEVLDKWIGAIEIDTKLPPDNKHKPLSELSSWWADSLNSIKDDLPAKPLYQGADKQNWTLFELKPQQKEEYYQQQDIFLGKSMYKALWQNAHSGRSFSSERFSRHGEIFCYVKIDGREKLNEERFKDKGDIEDALEGEFLKSKVGCIMGGGTGLHYSYIDLALIDLEKGIETVKNVLRKGNVTKKAWILFFDSELISEWIGIWDDSPAPPMPDFEKKE